MPDIGIAIIETCLTKFSELPFEDAIAALDYIHRRLTIKENKRRLFEAQKQKLGRDPTEDEMAAPADEWEEVAGPAPATSAPYPPGGIGLSDGSYAKRAM